MSSNDIGFQWYREANILFYLLRKSIIIVLAVNLLINTFCPIIIRNLLIPLDNISIYI